MRIKIDTLQEDKVPLLVIHVMKLDTLREIVPGMLIYQKQCQSLEGNNPRVNVASTPVTSMSNCVYLETTFKQVKWSWLLDSGCDHSVLPYKLVRDEPLQFSDQTLYAANGSEIKVMGLVNINLEISGMKLPTSALVSNYVREPILGIDWLKANRSVWDFAEEKMTLQGKPINLVRIKRPSACHRIVAAQNMSVPSSSQCAIPARIEYGRWWGDVNKNWMTENAELHSGLKIARSLLPDRNDDIPVLVLNASDDEKQIKKDKN